MNRDVRSLIKSLRKQGWEVEPTNAGHFRAKGPKGGLVFLPCSPSDHRGLKNVRSELRKRGADV